MKKDAGEKERGFFERVWFSLPIGVGILVVVAAIGGGIISGLRKDAESLDLSVPTYDEPNSALWRVLVGIYSLVFVVTVGACVSEGSIGPGRDEFSAVGRGFGYGTACLFIVCAYVAVSEERFTLLPWWILAGYVLLVGTVLVDAKLEVTGNVIIDSLVASALFIALAHVLASGALCGVECGYFFSGWVLIAWGLGSLLIGFILRLAQWLRE